MPSTTSLPVTPGIGVLVRAVHVGHDDQVGLGQARAELAPERLRPRVAVRLEHRDESGGAGAAGDAQRDRQLGRGHDRNRRRSRHHGRFRGARTGAGHPRIAASASPLPTTVQPRRTRRVAIAAVAFKQVVRAVHLEGQRGRDAVGTGHGAARPAGPDALDRERPSFERSVPYVTASTPASSITERTPGSSPHATTASHRAMNVRERGLDLVEPTGVEVDVIDVHVRHDADPMWRQQERPVALVRLEDEEVAGARARAAPALVEIAADQEGRDRARRLRGRPRASRSSWSCRACRRPRSIAARSSSAASACGARPHGDVALAAPRRSSAFAVADRARDHDGVGTGLRDVRRVVTHLDARAQASRARRSPFESLRSDPLTVDAAREQELARGSACPAPPIPIRWTRRDTRRATGTSSVGMLPGGGEYERVFMRGRPPRRGPRAGRRRQASPTRRARPPSRRSLLDIVHELRRPTLARTAGVRSAVEQTTAAPRAPARARSRPDGSRSRAGTAPGSTAARRPRARRRRAARPRDDEVGDRVARAPSGRGTAPPRHARRRTLRRAGQLRPVADAGAR